MVIFPNNSLIGYSLENTLERFPFLHKENLKWLNGLAKLTSKTTVIIGEIDNTGQNSIAILKDGKIDKFIKNNEIYSLNGIKYAISVFNPLENDFINNFKNKVADVIIICHSTASKAGKEEKLQNAIASIAKTVKLPIIYVNSAGATDNLSFDGASRSVGADGKVFARAKSFEEDFIILNPLTNEGQIASLPKGSDNVLRDSFSLDYENDLERTYKTIIQGIKDYFKKCGLKRAVLGLSGGLDSTVCAVLLTDALGKENVYGISMPSKLTSSESKSDAKELADNLGINFEEIPIKTVFETTTDCLNPLFERIETNWNDRYKKSFTPDNIQARARATYLWCISNEFPSCIPISTSDKSEAYMGYATINGDMSGGFAPIADVTKTKLFALARWLNKNRTEKNAIPESVILKKPGAELAIDPRTLKTLNAEDALMPYEFLDEIIWRIENKNEEYNDLIQAEFIYEKEHKISKEQKIEWIEKFFSRMSKAHYKWSILPPSVIVDSHSINSAVYKQPVTSGKINYKGSSEKEIAIALNEV